MVRTLETGRFGSTWRTWSRTAAASCEGSPVAVRTTNVRKGKEYCVSGKNISGLTRLFSPQNFTSATTPTTSRHGWLGSFIMSRLPIADAPGQYRRAMVSLTMTTKGVVAVSAPVKVRPSRNVIPIALT